MRQEIPIIVLGADGRPYAGASVAVRKDPAGTDATIYQAKTGGATSPNPLTSDAQGRVEGWLDRGDYAATITGVPGIGPWVESFPIGSQNDGHIDLAEIPDGLITSAKIADATIQSGDLIPSLRPSSVIRAGLHSARPAANAAGLEVGSIWHSTDKWMQWLTDGAQWVLLNAEAQPLAALPPNAPAAPATPPVDGQRVSLPWGKARIVCRYNAGLAGAAKWEVESGTPSTVKRTASGNMVLADGTLYQPPLQIVCPWIGDYFVQTYLNVRIQQVTALGNGYILLNGVDTAMGYMRFASATGAADPSPRSGAMHGEITTTAANGTVQTAFSTNATTASVVSEGALSVTPLRIG